VLVLRVAVDQDLLDRDGSSIVEVWAGAIELHERGCVEVVAPVELTAGADVVELQVGVERRRVAGLAAGLLALEDLLPSVGSALSPPPLVR